MPSALTILFLIYLVVRIVAKKNGKKAPPRNQKKVSFPQTEAKEPFSPLRTADAGEGEDPCHEAMLSGRGESLREPLGKRGYSVFEAPFKTDQPEPSFGEHTDQPLQVSEEVPSGLDFDADKDLLRAVIWKEILDRPVSRRV